MSASDNSSYFSRFLLKFIEITAAGLATAVSGYLIAHLSGALSSSTPTPAAAIIELAPSTGAVASSPAQPTAPNASAVVSAPVQAIAPSTSPAAQPIPPVADKPDQQSVPSEQEVNASPSTSPARKTINPIKPELARKRVEKVAPPAVSTREQDLFVSRVRGALTSVDANRAASGSPIQRSVTGPSPAIAQPVPTVDPPRAAAVSARPATATELRSPPIPAAPIDPNLSTPVEIKSQPVVEAQSPPAPPAEKDTGVLSTLEQMLRHDPLAARDDAPRPPMPVGQ